MDKTLVLLSGCKNFFCVKYCFLGKYKKSFWVKISFLGEPGNWFFQTGVFFNILLYLYICMYSLFKLGYNIFKTTECITWVYIHQKVK